MFDDFSHEEAEEFINIKVPKIHRKLVLQALNTNDVSEITDLGLTLVGEKPYQGSIVSTGAPAGPRSSVWQMALDEVYKFFCTDDEAYKKERKEGVGIFEQCIPMITSSLASTLNVGIGLLTGITTLVVICVFKMGRNAWCQWKASSGQTPSTTLAP